MKSSLLVHNKNSDSYTKGLSVNLSIGHQNKEGLHHTTLGCKLGNCLTLHNDVEILSETWSECENCKSISETENHILLDSIAPIKAGKRGRKSGGIKIYVKKHLESYLKVKSK